jgi:hypothetical protein
MFIYIMTRYRIDLSEINSPLIKVFCEPMEILCYKQVIIIENTLSLTIAGKWPTDFNAHKG